MRDEGFDMSLNLILGGLAVVATVAVTLAVADAAPGGNGNGNGNANGIGFGNGNGNGRGNNGNGFGNGGSVGGAPLPLVGVTLVGQLTGAGGLYLMWRRRRRQK